MIKDSMLEMVRKTAEAVVAAQTLLTEAREAYIAEEERLKKEKRQ